MAQLLDQLHVDVAAEPNEQNNGDRLPGELAVPAVEPQLVERPEEQRNSIVSNGECSIPALEPTGLPGPSAGSQEHVQPPDITSTIGQTQPSLSVAVAEGGQEPRPADILDQVPLTDRPADSDSSGSLKPQQFTVEPDIVASTKKPPPSRPPPPSGGPPARPPPPSRPKLPTKKSQECVRPSGLEGRQYSAILMGLNVKCVASIQCGILNCYLLLNKC